MDVSLARNGRWSYLHCNFLNTARRPSKFSACRKNARRWGAEAAALSFGMTVMLAPVHDDAEIEEAIAIHRASQEATPSICERVFRYKSRCDHRRDGPSQFSPNRRGDLLPRAGGLMSYWFDSVHVHAQGASYVDSILKAPLPPISPFSRQRNSR
jgi:hypothetical protein